MIDDEKLQELLTRASSLYNNGQYQGAIEAWQEALAVDPQSQKAREGIRMATLLLGDWEPSPPSPGAEEEPAAPADGAGGTAPEMSPEEIEASLDVGIARVKQLLAERKYQEAIEGARSLLPLSPSSEEVQRLLEEAQQAFESAPFIEEHLALSRDLLAQERYAEAEAECKKVFVLDRAHPGARALLAEIKDKIQQSLKRAASQLGGMTVKLTLPEVLAAGAGRAAREEDAGPEESGPAPEPDVTERVYLEMQPGSPAPEEPTVVEAKTIVPPSTRLIPSQPPAPPPAQEPRGAAPEPVKAPAPPDSIPVSETGGTDETAAWEAELAQLNLRAGERDLLKGTAAKATGIPVDQSADVDLLSLLDEPGGAAPTSDPASAARPAEAPVAAPPEATAPRPESRDPGQVAPERPRPQGRKEPAGRVSPLHLQESPSAATRARGQRVRASGSPGSKPRSSGGRMVALLGLLLLASAGAAYWFYFQPRLLGGTGSPDQPVTPPSGSSSGIDPDPTQGPIPTPIGGSRQQGGPQSEEAIVGAAPGAHPTGSGAIEDSPGESEEGDAVVEVAPVKPVPIKPPEPPPLSREEIRRRVALFTEDGRRLIGLGRWREARDKLSAAMALDPVNFEVKELLDKAQSRVDDEQRLHDELESVKSLIAENDYENALRKLYRLPRDKGLGDLDLYTRNAWYNWAVILMKAGNVSDAIQKLSEALAIDPDDAAAIKLQGVAERYVSRAKDRVYYAFIDALKVRAYNQR